MWISIGRVCRRYIIWESVPDALRANFEGGTGDYEKTLKRRYVFDIN